MVFQIEVNLYYMHTANPFLGLRAVKYPSSLGTTSQVFAPFSSPRKPSALNNSFPGAFGRRRWPAGNWQNGSRARQHPNPWQHNRCLLFEYTSYLMQEVFARAGSHVSLDDAMPHEIIGFLPCIEQLVRVLGFEQAFLILTTNPASSNLRTIRLVYPSSTSAAWDNSRWFKGRSGWIRN